jgi:nucleotide-binding universal stress UspA family protein
MPTLQKILVPTDLSDGSEAAFDYAVFLAKPFQAALDLLHVWEPPRYLEAETAVSLPGLYAGTLSDVMQTRATHALDVFVAKHQNRGFPLTHRIEAGNPAERIVQVAESGGCDLIVMGTQGRSGLMHVLLGSVAEKVVRKARCPVVTVRARSA